MKQFLLTEAIFKRLTTRNGGKPLICVYCGHPIQPMNKEWEFTFNDGLLRITIIKTPQVVSLERRHKGKVKLYHAECYEKTLH